MKDSKRVPGYSLRPIDVAGIEHARKDNMKQYEVKGDDLNSEKKKERR